jgi:hypothetical protein
LPGPFLLKTKIVGKRREKREKETTAKAVGDFLWNEVSEIVE